MDADKPVHVRAFMITSHPQYTYKEDSDKWPRAPWAHSDSQSRYTLKSISLIVELLGMESHLRGNRPLLRFEGVEWQENSAQYNYAPFHGKLHVLHTLCVPLQL